MSKIRGYSGFYKSNYLRSSYEYVYCKILEKLKLDYKYEEKLYNLKNFSFLPDFHIYKDNVLLEIVEIKSDYKKEVDLVKIKVNELKSLVKVPVKIYRFTDLKKQCESLNLDINVLITNWKSNFKGNSYKGLKNPMYGKSHSIAAKNAIGKKSLERWQTKEFIEKRQKSLPIYDSKNPHPSKGITKVKRIECKCIECNKVFTKKITDPKKYCSRNCAIISATEIANSIVRQAKEKLHSSIKKDILTFIHNNYNFFLKRKRNLLYTELKVILKKYGLKDIRNVKFIFTGSYNSSFDNLYESIQNEYNNYLKCMPNLHDDKV